MENRMVTIPDGNICIPMDVYDDFVSDSLDLAILLSCLFQNCGLGYKGKYLVFDGEAVSMILSLLDHNRYKNTLSRLREEENNAETD